jgi:hypothetical protein
MAGRHVRIEVGSCVDPLKETEFMSKFILLFRGGGITVQPPPPPAELGAHLAKWTQWVGGLISSGKADPGPPPLETSGKTLRGSAKSLTDGPFAEAKDLVSGFLVVSAESLDAAVELARGCPIFEYDGSVEVRPFRSMPSHAT